MLNIDRDRVLGHLRETNLRADTASIALALGLSESDTVGILRALLQDGLVRVTGEGAAAIWAATLR